MMVDLDFREIIQGEGPKKRPPRFFDPRIVNDHFRPLLTNIPSPEARWKSKANAQPFPGL
jgi:hypothetical protein